jgi:hypothetical protein
LFLLRAATAVAPGKLQQFRPHRHSDTGTVLATAENHKANGGYMKIGRSPGASGITDI